MRFICGLILSISLLACGPGSQVDLGDAGVTPQETTPKTELTLSSVTLSEAGPLILTVGAQEELSVSAILSDDSQYDGITSAFNDDSGDVSGDIYWFSNDESIVSVSDSGVLTATGAGSTTVKASLINKSASVDVIVSEASEETSVEEPQVGISQAEPIRIRRLFFATPEQTITNLESFSLKLNILFSDDSFYSDLSAQDLQNLVSCPVQFWSSDETVASVDVDGNVTPHQDGIVRFIVSCGAKHSRVRIRFSTTTEPDSESPIIDTTPPHTPPTHDDPEEANEVVSLAIVTEKTELSVGDSNPVACQVTFSDGSSQTARRFFTTPSGLRKALTWSSSDDSILQASSGSLQATAYGTASAIVSYRDLSASQEFVVKMAVEAPSSSSEYFLNANDTISTPSYGTNYGFGSGDFPTIIYGPPYTGGTHVLSLGGGGSIQIELNNYTIVDGIGDDFTIFENAIVSSYYGNFAERAQVSVSEDGVTYYPFACDAFDEDEIYAGCAGVNPVDATKDPRDPSVSGGDHFDLADVGLSEARYIIIQDMDTCTPDDPTYYTQTGIVMCATAGQQGFDLDAMIILNGINQ